MIFDISSPIFPNFFRRFCLKMNLITSLNNSISMPLVGFGTYKIQTPEVVNEVIGVALESGYRSFDTAAVYHNEAAIARALKEHLPKNKLHREDVFVTTKLAPEDHGTEKCSKAFEKSLSNLDLDYVDVYLIHWPGVRGLHQDDVSVPNLRRKSWLQMEKFYKDGKAKAIGVSNYTIRHLKELLEYCTIKPAILQVEYHPHLVQEELRQFCHDNAIHLQAYSSLGTSSSDNPLLKEKTVLDIAAKLDKTPAQILLRWAVQQEIGVIPKSVHSDFIKSNFDITSFELSSIDMNRLNALNKNTHYCWDPEKVR